MLPPLVGQPIFPHQIPAPLSVDSAPIQEVQTGAEVVDILDKLGFNKVLEEMAAKEAANAREENNVQKKFPAVFKMMEQVGVRSADGMLSPRPQLTFQEKEVPLLTLTLKKKTDEEKAEFYATVMQLIAFELEYLQMSHRYNESATRSKILQDIFVKMGGDFVGRSPVVSTVDINSFFHSSAGFACYMRYTKKVSTNPDLLLALQDNRVFSRFHNSKDPAVKAQMAVLKMCCFTEQKNDFFVKNVGPLLARTQYFFASPVAFEIARQFTPALALLTSLDMDMGEKLDYMEKFDPQVDPEKLYYLPLRKKIMEALCESYVDKQMFLYQKAYEQMQGLLKKYPKWRENHNYVSRFMKSDPLPNPDDFAADMRNQVGKMSTARIAQANQMALALEQEEDARIAALVKKKAKNTLRKKKTKLLQAKKEPVINKKPAEKPPAGRQESLLLKITQTIQKPSPLQRHERVKRWLRLSPTQLNVIRTFKDFRNGQEVYQYAGLSDQELQAQLTLHGFSPIIDKLLGNAELRKKYCHETARGVALFVELVRENEPIQRGVLHLGIDPHSSLCFHRKIDLKTDNEFLDLSFSQLAEIKEDEGYDAAKQQALKEELESGFEGGTDVQFDAGMEIISVTDKKLKCQINVFPLG